MTDSDIRRWLARQTHLRVNHIPLDGVRGGALHQRLAALEGLIVVDAIEDTDLRIIAKAIASARFLTGGSAIAAGLPGNFRNQGLIGTSALPAIARPGPTIVLSGSCSIATNAQVEAYRTTNPSIAVDVDRLLAGDRVLEEVDAFMVAHADRAPVAYSTASPDESRRFIQPDGVNSAAAAIEHVLAELAVRAAARGVTKIVVAGGETSGGIVSALDPGPLQVGRMIAPGVPLLGNARFAFVLKSGNFGGPDFLGEAVRALEPAA